MSSYDLTEAVEAAVQALRAAGLADADGGGYVLENVYADGAVHVALTAALPHLEQQIRDQIAADLEAEAANYAEPNGINPQEDGERIGLTRAADIARGATEGDTDHD